MTTYSLHYEEAAHMVQLLCNAGLPLNHGISVHHQLSFVAATLEIIQHSRRSHFEAGAWIVGILHLTEPLSDKRRKRFNAIAGTLVGNFLLRCPPRPTRKVSFWADLESRQHSRGSGRFEK